MTNVTGCPHRLVTNVTSCLPWENFPDCLGKISQVPCVDFPSVLWFSRSFSQRALAIFPECLGEISPSTLGAVLWFFPSVLWFFPACIGNFPSLGEVSLPGKNCLDHGKKKIGYTSRFVRVILAQGPC